MRAEQLVERVRPHRSVVVVAHNNPDPDAMAAAWGVRELLHQKTGRWPRVLAGGALTRAENREMYQLLSPPIEFLDQYSPRGDDFLIFVDCRPDTSNHLVDGPHTPARTAIIDHHGDSRQGDETWVDLRPRVVATASIVSSYLKQAEVEPGRRLSTALVFAIRTEASGGETFFSGLDRRMLNWLTPLADPALLARIEQAPLPVGYYSDLMRAIQAAEILDDTVFCRLPQLPGADFVGEMSDLLIRCEDVRRVLCVGAFEEKMFLSVRTLPGGGNATEHVAAVIDRLGASGGHLRRAGGLINLHGRSAEKLAETVRGRWFKMFQAQGQPQSLVPRR
jgi:hypothetical protein